MPLAALLPCLALACAPAPLPHGVSAAASSEPVSPPLRLPRALTLRRIDADLPPALGVVRDGEKGDTEGLVVAVDAAPALLEATASSLRSRGVDARIDWESTPGKRPDGPTLSIEVKRLRIDLVGPRDGQRELRCELEVHASLSGAGPEQRSPLTARVRVPSGAPPWPTLGQALAAQLAPGQPR